MDIFILELIYAELIYDQERNHCVKTKTTGLRISSHVFLDVSSTYIVYPPYNGIILYMANCTNIEKNESMFAYHLVWPLLCLAVKTATSPNRNLLFKAGKVILDSSDETFKADGVIELDGIEFCLLETSGTYGLSDSSRFGKDHFNATEETLLELKVIFVHARGKRIHMWSLEMPVKDVQVLKHLTYADTPTDTSQDCLQKSCKAINKMKEGHMDYQLMRQLNPNNQSRIKLATLVQNEIQKPVKGSDYGIILPKQTDNCDLDSTILAANQ
ncbi:MAG: hypothetical protein EXX96DRAFT_609537 [Benjaminiella poitrasii]|nr:MAG: hypothetical protein EXX96DRAFT_609537 [Benjaminiella poitrasii]